MELLTQFVELFENTSLPLVMISTVTILFATMFSVLVSVLLLLIEIGAEQGVFLQKRRFKKKKPNKTQPNDDNEVQPQENQRNAEKGPQNQDPNNESTVNNGNQLTMGTENEPHSATPEDQYLPQQQTPNDNIERIPRDLQADLSRMLKVLLRTNKLNFIVVLFLVVCVILHLVMIIVDGFSKHWVEANLTALNQASLQAAEMALKGCGGDAADATVRPPVEEGATPAPFKAP